MFNANSRKRTLIKGVYFIITYFMSSSCHLFHVPVQCILHCTILLAPTFSFPAFLTRSFSLFLSHSYSVIEIVHIYQTQFCNLIPSDFYRSHSFFSYSPFLMQFTFSHLSVYMLPNYVQTIDHCFNSTHQSNSAQLVRLHLCIYVRVFSPIRILHVMFLLAYFI
jgi:hypothetical protein